jgi:DNA polymerase-3 subunit alpha
MCYISLEDDTGIIEMMAFSNVLSQYGNLMQENSPVIIVGRLSRRDDKDAQIVINRVIPMQEIVSRGHPQEAPPQPKAPEAYDPAKTLYLRLPSEEGLLFKKTKAALAMFPGNSKVVAVFTDTGIRRGTTCSLAYELVEELKYSLGNENVVVK